jgi:hypothetical protein
MLFGDAAEPLALTDLLEDGADESLAELLPDSGEEQAVPVPTPAAAEEPGAADFEGSVAGELLDMIQPAASQTSES